MKRGFTIFLLCGSLGLAASCTAPGDAPSSRAAAGKDCFNISQITGYEAVDDDTIKLRVGVGDEYELDLEGGQCNNVDWTQKLAIESTPSSWVCTGKDPAQGYIHFRDPTTNRRVQCYIGDVRRVVKSEQPNGQ